MNNDKTQERIDMIIRQTDYTQETAEQKLLEFNNDVMAVIRDYMKPTGSGSIPSNTPTDIKYSKNQQIYKEIRGMMDNAARNYEERKAKQ
jgi:hypothetical protein